jgi:hypothetical protein
MPDMSLERQTTGEEAQPLPRVVLCGDARTAEFEAALRYAIEVTALESITCVSTFAHLRESLIEDGHPDLLVIVQTWSDEFHFDELLTLPGIGPYSHIICCYGPWCASDGRSRQNFPLALRVPVEHLSATLSKQWRHILSGSGPSLDWTAGRDEVFQYQYGRRSVISVENGRDSHAAPPATKTQPSVQIHCADRELSNLWLETLKSAGMMTGGTADQANEQHILWDVDVWSDSIADEWQRLLVQSPATHIIAVAGFITADLSTKMCAAGARRVTSKLIPLDSIVAGIQ